MMMLRYALTGLLLMPLAATAQIVIDDFPFPRGTGPFAQYNTDNLDGTNTTVINTLVGQSGANQTYDLTTIDYEDLFTGQYALTDGAVGPGAATEPLDQATLTLALPFNLEEEGNMYEGIIYDYVLETANTNYNLGGIFEGTFNGGPIEFSTTRTPNGDPEFVFPMMMGSMWSGAFTETTMLGGSTFSTDITMEYEVDGWGSMLVPDIEEPVEVLRVKITETRTVAGFDFSTVCYELRANALVEAVFCEGDFDKNPTAYVTILNATATDAASEPSASSLTLEAVYPNPVHEHAALRYNLPEAGAVTLTVYDVLGKAVMTLVEQVQGAGAHEVVAETRDLAPGVYVVRLQADGAQQTRAFTVVR